MHTTQGPKGVYFVHDGDYGGQVKIFIPSDTANMELSHQDHTVMVEVPMEALEFFVARKIVSKYISSLEQAVNMDEVHAALRGEEVQW